MNNLIITLASAAVFARALQKITVLAQKAFAESNFNVTRKDDNSPVTQIDLVTQERVVALCRQFFGHDINIIAEESGFDKKPVPSESPWTAYIDPIDGTIPLCAGDISSSNIAIGIFYEGKPYLGFVGQLSNGEVLYGGKGIDGNFEMSNEGLLQPLFRPPVATENKMWCFEIGGKNWSDPLHRGTLMNLFGDLEAVGCNHYTLPSVAAGLKVVFGHARFFIGGKNSKPWDVAAFMPLLEVLGYQLVELKTGKALTLAKSADRLPSFVMADSVEAVDHVIRHRPLFVYD